MKTWNKRKVTLDEDLYNLISKKCMQEKEISDKFILISQDMLKLLK